MANFTGTCLLVVGDAGSLSDIDIEQKDRLEGLGYTVTPKSDEDAFLDTDSNWETFDVAVIVESTSGTTLGTSGRDAVVGILVLEPATCDDYDLTSTNPFGRDTTTLVWLANDAVGAGLAGTAGAGFSVAVASLTKLVFGATTQSSGSVNVCEQPSSGENPVVRWESGATLITGTAADRRVFNGLFFIDPDDPPNEDVDGFVVNDTGWALFDAAVFWCHGIDLDTETDLQLGLPVADLVTTGWAKDDATNYFEDVNDGEVPDAASTAIRSPNNPVASPISFDLTSLTDPTNDRLHTVAVGWQRETGTRVLTLDIQLRQGYVNESTLGTLIASSGAITASTTAGWAGSILQLTPTEADNITDYADLQIRLLADSSGGGATTRVEVTSIRLLIDGAPAAVATVYPPFPRRQNTLVRM